MTEKPPATAGKRLSHPDAEEIVAFYWDTDISTKEIVRAYGLSSAYELQCIVGTATFDDLRCSHCTDLIEVVTRSDLRMRLGQSRYGGDQVASFYPRLCRHCGTDALSRRHAEQREQFERHDRERREREQVLHRMPYREYLQSAEWKETRQAALKRARFRCQTCAAGGQLNVHHRTYVRRGFERASDLIVLCADCHRLFHEKAKLTDGGRADE